MIIDSVVGSSKLGKAVIATPMLGERCPVWINSNFRIGIARGTLRNCAYQIRY